MIYTLKNLLLMLCIIALSSCEKKLLLEPHTHDSHTLLAVNYPAGLPTARTVTALFYPRSGEARLTRTISGNAGEMENIPTGVYDILVYTSDFYDMDAIRYRGMENPATAEAYTGQTPPPPATAVKMVEPDPLYSVYVDSFTVSTGANTIQRDFAARTYKYDIVIDTIVGLQYVHSCKMEIQGLLTSVFLKDGRNPTSLDGTVAVDMALNKPANRMTGEFYSFGIHASTAVKNTVTLTFANGESKTFVLDDSNNKISNLFKAKPKGGTIPIKVKIVITQQGGEAGYTPNVSIWTERNEEIRI